MGKEAFLFSLFIILRLWDRCLNIVYRRINLFVVYLVVHVSARQEEKIVADFS